jgi:Ca-activated chloride channel homolog
VRRRFAIRLAVACGVSGAIALALGTFVLGHGVTLPVHAFGHEAELLAPQWLYVLALLPYLWLVRGESLTDLSLVQQGLSLFVRAVVIAGAALALARPTTIARDDKLATVLLADVSDSISDKQLAAAQSFIDQAFAAKRKDDRMFVVTFAERPRVVRSPSGGAGTEEQPPRIARHDKAGAGTDIQAALQLAYGLYPPGYLPRAVVLSDGNQTSGDVLAEAYKAHDFGVRVGWQVFPADAHREVRAVALHLPDGIKVGAPFELSAEVWSTHEQDATLMLQADDFPNALEPVKVVRLHEGANRIAFKSEAKAAGVTTYTLRVTPKDPTGDENKLNNTTVAAAPVRGRPRILYLEGEYDRDPQVASYLRRALDRETWRCAGRARRRRRKRSSSATISCWSPTCPRCFSAWPRCRRSRASSATPGAASSWPAARIRSARAATRGRASRRSCRCASTARRSSASRRSRWPWSSTARAR